MHVGKRGSVKIQPGSRGSALDGRRLDKKEDEEDNKDNTEGTEHRNQAKLPPFPPLWSQVAIVKEDCQCLFGSQWIQVSLLWNDDPRIQ